MRKKPKARPIVAIVVRAVADVSVSLLSCLANKRSRRNCVRWARVVSPLYGRVAYAGGTDKYCRDRAKITGVGSSITGVRVFF